ncbi:MAG: PAS domain S-box protein [Candidatus Rokubacteria bacterium]|nr:PAS domain S-box protein [Candidatus Rokubacteria bacterium]
MSHECGTAAAVQALPGALWDQRADAPDETFLEALLHAGIEIGRVAEQAQAEERLRETEQRHRTVFAESRDAIGIVGAGGEVLEINQAGLDLFGYSAAEVAGLRVKQLYADPADRARFLEEIGRSGAVRDLEVRFRRKDGTLIDSLLSGALWRGDAGSQPGYHVVIHDITERRRLEAQLRQSQKMEAIGGLAGGIAHDFGNLLTVIIGRAQLLLGGLPSDDQRRADLDLIQKTAVRASALVQQLLAFSRKQVLQPKVLDPDALVSGMVTMLGRLIGEDIELVVAPRSEGARIKADPGQLEQVILNLVVNARDAMPRGGRLVLETAQAELGESFAREHPGARLGPHVVLAVSDTGVGMDAATRARIFEPFFTTKEAGRGTGLGLSTVYGIAKQHEGYIAVESEPGRGTTFRVYLPRVQEAVAPEVGSPAPAGRGSEIVLLVEDEEEVRSLSREILEAGGYSVLEAPSPSVALDIARQHGGPIHLLLTDIVMPQMNGLRLAEKLRALRPGLRVLHMSGYSDDILGRQGSLDPGLALLRKPFTPNDLVRAVREALDQVGPGPR